MKHSILLLLASSLLLVGCQPTSDRSPPPLDGDLTLTLLHINDHHSHLAPHALDVSVSELPLSVRSSHRQPVEKVRVAHGGFTRLATLFRQLHGESVNPVRIHAGDALTGTLYYSQFAGAADAMMMNHLCFDIFTLGNHEFDRGDAALAGFLEQLQTDTCTPDVLAANLQPGPHSALAGSQIQPSVIKQIDGHRVGFVGLVIAQKTQFSSSPDRGTVFVDEVTAAQNAIQQLRAQGVERIVLVTHYQYQNDVQLAARLSGVDVIVGGDSHTLLGPASLRGLGLEPAGDYPTLARNRDGDTVCIVQAWDHARLLGKLEVKFDSNGTVRHCRGQVYLPVSEPFTYTHHSGDTRTLSPADSQKVRRHLDAYPELAFVAEDAAAQERLRVFDQAIQDLEQRVIGHAKDNLCHTRLPASTAPGSCPHSDIATAVARSFLAALPSADIALQNAGGVRTGLAAGPVTYAQARAVLPFDNTLILFDLSGGELQNLLEEAVDYALAPTGSSGAYPYAAGLRFRVDASKPRGERLSRVEINRGLRGQWQPLEQTARLQLVVNSFMASGQDGYHTLGKLRRHGRARETHIPYSQAFVDTLIDLQKAGKELEKPSPGFYATQSFQHDAPPP